MTDQLLSELRKMRSTRTNLGLLAGMIALILIFLLAVGLTGTSSDLGDHDHQHRLIDPILGSVVPRVGRFTPIAVSASFTADPTDYLLAPLGGGLLLLAYVATFVAAGHLLVARRDVT